LDQRGAVEAVSTFTGWILEDKIWDPGLVTDDREGFGNELLSMFLTGGAWYWGVMKSEYPDTYDKAKVFPYPRYKDGEDFGGIGYGYSTYVTQSSDHQKEAWMVADAIASTPDDFIAEGLFQPRIGYSEQVARDNLPSWDVFGEELKHASPRPLTQYYEELIAIFFKAVSQIVYEGKDVKTALDQANANITEVVSQ
jgi:ABC-type glycerol-3-phosphate transport system substrate-binding protein